MNMFVNNAFVQAWTLSLRLDQVYIRAWSTLLLNAIAMPSEDNDDIKDVFAFVEILGH